MTTAQTFKTTIVGLARRRAAQVVAAVVAMALVGGVVLWQRSGLPDGAALRVGDTVVSEAQLRHDVSTLRALYGVQPPTGADELDAFWRDSAQATAVSRVLDEAAKDQGIVIAQSKVDQGLASYVAALYENAPDARARFLKALGTAGTSEKSVKIEIRRRLTVDTLLDTVTRGATAPTAPELKTAYAERGCTLVRPETRTISNIVVTSETDAVAIVDDLAAGAAFADLARTRSGDELTRDKGGNLGPVTATQLEEGYAAVAFAAPKDTVFGPLKTESGWNVGVVTAVTPATDLAYEAVEQSLSKQMLLERQSTLWQAWLQQHVQDADVAYAADYRPDDPDALPEGIASWSKAQRGLCAPGQAPR